MTGDGKCASFKSCVKGGLTSEGRPHRDPSETTMTPLFITHKPSLSVLWMWSTGLLLHVNRHVVLKQLRKTVQEQNVKDVCASMFVHWFICWILTYERIWLLQKLDVSVFVLTCFSDFRYFIKNIKIYSSYSSYSINTLSAGNILKHLPTAPPCGQLLPVFAQRVPRMKQIQQIQATPIWIAKTCPPFWIFGHILPLLAHHPIFTIFGWTWTKVMRSFFVFTHTVRL